MSQYINFFIRCDDKFFPLFSFSRNSYMYSAFHTRAPFEKISVISEEMINLSKEVLLDQIDTYQRKVTQYEREKTLIPSFDNTGKTVTFCKTNYVYLIAVVKYFNGDCFANFVISNVIKLEFF